ncbi:hypothetical protein TNCV_167421 [Trichonephila clavipes]|nr:hypothetical protein TNCV_167421 [Trichonephila clavipes]
MSGRKYKSAAEKRKLLLNRENKVKCVKNLTFFTMKQSNKNTTNAETLTRERESSLAKENGETQQANINDENMQDYDDQQPLLKKILFSQRTSVMPRPKSV